jgi:hypothetical protein
MCVSSSQEGAAERFLSLLYDYSFKFLVFFVAINRRFYIRNIIRNYRRADEEEGTDTIRLRDIFGAVDRIPKRSCWCSDSISDGIFRTGGVSSSTARRRFPDRW